jgi:hypothetical protein
VNVVNPMVYVEPFGAGSERILTQTANGGENQVFGFDLYARYEADRLSLWTSYSFVDVQNVVNNVQTGLPQISRHNVRFGFTWTVCENLKVTPSVVYRSTPENVSNPDGLVDELQDPYELNIYLLYTPAECFDLFADFRNVTDHKYALRGILGPMPQETFYVNAGARWRF